MENCLKKVLEYLPDRLSEAVDMLPENVKTKTDELRLRRGGLFSVTAGGRNYGLLPGGRLCRLPEGMTVTPEETDECLARLCESSLYSYDETIRRGYIPFPFGRAGVCGEAVCEGGTVARLKTITSINLRVHRFIPDCAAGIVKHYARGGVCGTLIYSPPGMGKTTLLRSAAALLAEGKYTRPYRVAVADERNEIILPGCRHGLTDVISGCPKAEAVEMLCRCMSPEVIICDEIGRAETEQLLKAADCGTALICSAHAADTGSLEDRGFIGPGSKNLFPLLVRATRTDGIYGFTAEEI